MASGSVARRSHLALGLSSCAAQAQPQSGVLADLALRARLEETGLAPYGGPPERLATHLGAELRHHAEIVRRSGARLD
ncbi:hypothetical protein JMJ56_20590 [Belnapia sp. T18]|uniref:Uncharacterized protein n=1 Tax=Belnapia arida TaxID=2804533 RepID=A0ABS1U6U1_9PROT|nr:hypothetical protein [Belnapia arida]MBL6080419.1 hypothetical protein [Belnapia arida]